MPEDTAFVPIGTILKLSVPEPREQEICILQPKNIHVLHHNPQYRKPLPKDPDKCKNRAMSLLITIGIAQEHL